MKALVNGVFARNSNLVITKSISDDFFFNFSAALFNINFNIRNLICSQDVKKTRERMGLSIYKISRA